MLVAVAMAPASTTAVRSSKGSHVRWNRTRDGRELWAFQRLPTAPTPTENSAESPDTATAGTRSPGACATAAHAPKAKTGNSEPGGCQSWAKARLAAPAATTPLSATATQVGCGSRVTALPATTQTTSAAPAESCIAARDRWTWLRP